MNYSWLTINVLVTCLQEIVLTIVFTLHPLSGRGVFALVPFIKGDFVVEYRGEIITLIEAELRREANQDTFFMFDFIWQNKKWWYFFFYIYIYIFFLSIHFKITIKKIKKSNFLFCSSPDLCFYGFS